MTHHVAGEAAHNAANRTQWTADPQSGSPKLSSLEIEWLCPSLNNQPFDALKAFGMAAWLWGQSPLHKDWRLKFMAPTIWPAIMHRQFLIGRDKTYRPVVFVSWAQLDEARERQYLQNPNSLSHDDWASGDRVWFIDWITPFGGALATARKIEHDVFPQSAGHSLHVKAGSDTARIYDHYGCRVSDEQKRQSQEQLQQSLKAVFLSQQPADSASQAPAQEPFAAIQAA